MVQDVLGLPVHSLVPVWWHPSHCSLGAPSISLSTSWVGRADPNPWLWREVLPQAWLVRALSTLQGLQTEDEQAIQVGQRLPPPATE